MEELRITLDDWSIQVTSPNDPRFFLRISRDQSTVDRLVITDFLLSENSTKLAQTALSAAMMEFGTDRTLTQVVCTNINPNFSRVDNHEETVRRHDELVRIINAFFVANGRELDNAFLEPEGHTFATKIVLSPIAKRE